MSSSSEMALLGKIGGLATHSRHDSREVTAPARATFMARFEREVDPEGVLAPAERQRRAEYARKAHFARLALASARKRSKNKKQTAGDESAAAGVATEVRSDGAGQQPQSS